MLNRTRIVYIFSKMSTWNKHSKLSVIRGLIIWNMITCIHFIIFSKVYCISVSFEIYRFFTNFVPCSIDYHGTRSWSIDKTKDNQSPLSEKYFTWVSFLLKTLYNTLSQIFGLNIFRNFEPDFHKQIQLKTLTDQHCSFVTQHIQAL